MKRGRETSRKTLQKVEKGRIRIKANTGRARH